MNSFSFFFSFFFCFWVFYMFIGVVQAVARYIRSTLKNSSMVMSNMIGPVEQMSLANHPVKGLYFLVFGSPEVCHIYRLESCC